MPERLPSDALEFATLKHMGQTRKDAAQSPYIGHPIAVALVLRDEGRVSDETLLTAALLHDTVEDTATTIEEIESRFGVAVAALVQEVTDDKSLPKQRRKELQVEHAAHASPAAKQLKIADKICNLRDLAMSPPADWPAERLMAYVAWSESVFSGLKGVNGELDHAFLAAADRVRSALDADAALAAIQGHFHQLIASRAQRLVKEQQLELPVIAGLTASKDEPAWFPVPGMYGGFAYWLEPRDEGIALIAESWIRVVEGSGQRHEITADGCRLVAEGFV